MSKEDPGLVEDLKESLFSITQLASNQPPPVEEAQFKPELVTLEMLFHKDGSFHLARILIKFRNIETSVPRLIAFATGSHTLGFTRFTAASLAMLLHANLTETTRREED